MNDELMLEVDDEPWIIPARDRWIADGRVAAARRAVDRLDAIHARAASGARHGRPLHGLDAVQQQHVGEGGPADQQAARDEDSEHPHSAPLMVRGNIASACGARYAAEAALSALSRFATTLHGLRESLYNRL